MTQFIPPTYEEKKGWPVYIGLALIIIAGLLFIADYRASALEQFNASLPGERNAGDWFIFTMHNVSGTQDATHHFTVYS